MFSRIKILLFTLLLFSSNILIGKGIFEAQANSYKLSIVPISHKIRNLNGISPTINPKIKLHGARNEKECAQIVFYQFSQNIKKISFKCNKLSKGNDHLTSENISLYHVQDVNVVELSDSKGKLGLWPDPLVPISKPIAIQKDTKKVTIWIKINIPKGTPPGEYLGNIEINTNTNDKKNIPINLQVLEHELRDEDKIQLVTGLDYNAIQKQERAIKNTHYFENDILPRYYKFLRELEVRPTFIHNSLPTYKIHNNNLYFQFENFEEKISLAFQDHLNAPIAVPFAKDWPADSSQHGLFSAKYNQIVTTYLQQAVKLFRKHGLLHQAYIYFSELDEPKTADEFKKVKAYLKLLKKAAPELKVVITVYAKWEGMVMNELDEDNILWCPNITFFDGQAIKINQRIPFVPLYDLKKTQSPWKASLTQKLKKDKRPIWWYINPSNWILGEVKTNYPNLYIDRQGMDHRMLPIISYFSGIDVVAHWNATYWNECGNPWQRVPRGEENNQPNGDGSLFYPSAGSHLYTDQPDPNFPISTIRLELFREGSEDVAFIKSIKRLESVSKYFQKEIFSSMHKTITEYELNPKKADYFKLNIHKEYLKRKNEIDKL